MSLYEFRSSKFVVRKCWDARHCIAVYELLGIIDNSQVAVKEQIVLLVVQ